MAMLGNIFYYYDGAISYTNQMTSLDAIEVIQFLREYTLGPSTTVDLFFPTRIACNGVATYEDARVLTQEASSTSARSYI